MIRRSTKEKVFDFINYFLLTAFAALCVFPFIYVLAYSLTPYEEYLRNPVRLIPSKLTLDAYKQVLSNKLIYSGYKVTLFVSIVGTLINITLLCLSGYPLSKKTLKGRSVILAFIVFTMFFGGGLIPTYYVVRGLGLLNKPWALILPVAISPYNVVLMKNFMNTIPESLEESAVIDGANEIIVLFRIIIPLSKPAIATFALFSIVGHWNSYFSAVIYITKRSLWPLMLIMREIVIEHSTGILQEGVNLDFEHDVQPFTLKMAVIIIGILPIITAYPFLQKFFMKGLLIGSIKG